MKYSATGLESRKLTKLTYLCFLAYSSKTIDQNVLVKITDMFLYVSWYCVNNLKLSHDFHMTLCALICTEFREQSEIAAKVQKKLSPKS